MGEGRHTSEAVPSVQRFQQLGGTGGEVEAVELTFKSYLERQARLVVDSTLYNCRLRRTSRAFRPYYMYPMRKSANASLALQGRGLGICRRYFIFQILGLILHSTGQGVRVSRKRHILTLGLVSVLMRWRRLGSGTTIHYRAHPSSQHPVGEKQFWIKRLAMYAHAVRIVLLASRPGLALRATAAWRAMHECETPRKLNRLTIPHSTLDLGACRYLFLGALTGLTGDVDGTCCQLSTRP